MARHWSILLAILTIKACLDGVHGKPHEKNLPSWYEPDLPEPEIVHALHPVLKSKHQRNKYYHSLRNRKRHLSNREEMVPLFPGYGTHYAYLFVGNPAQRQSVIIDTGSRFTAFPCVGCKDCGSHTDVYYDAKNSTTAAIPTCEINSNTNPSSPPSSSTGGSGGGGHRHHRKTMEITTSTTKLDYCPISQSYTEGSSWDGYKVIDQVFVGGMEPQTLPQAPKYTLNFTFACLTHETGLFQSQLADGIMGMSNAIESLPSQLLSQGMTTSGVFALCFRIGGGILTLGGIDQRIHTKHNKITFLALDKNKSIETGWYHVYLNDIRMVNSHTKSTTDNKKVSLSIGMDKSHYLNDRGTILDSGTTDTYLPSSIKPKFEEIFTSISHGIPYIDPTTSATTDTGPNSFTLTPNQRASLPTLYFQFQGLDKDNNAMVEIEMPVESYLEQINESTYVFRIVFTEKMGNVVLGSNFMMNYNVLFDVEGKGEVGGRIGMAKSTCNYDEFTPHLPSNEKPIDSEIDCDAVDIQLVPYKQCTAQCNDINNPAYLSNGTQIYHHPCEGKKQIQYGVQQIRPCSEECSYTTVTKGLHLTDKQRHCPTKPWSECNHGCLRSRQIMHSENEGENEGDKGEKDCHYSIQTEVCYTGECSRHEGDYLVYIDMKLIQLNAQIWSYVYTEYCIQAFTELFQLKNNIELLHNIDKSSGSSSGSNSNSDSNSLAYVKLHFQIRIKAKDYQDNTIFVHAAAEKMLTKLHLPNFPSMFLQKLQELNTRYEASPLDPNAPPKPANITTRYIPYQSVAVQSRFGWMKSEDVVLLSAVALPWGNSRNPEDLGSDPTATAADGDADTENNTSSLWDYWLLGIVLGCVVVVFILAYLYFKLRQEYALLSKDKSSLAKSSKSFRSMWSKFTTNLNAKLQLLGVGGSNGNETLSKEQLMKEIELSRSSLMQEIEPDEEMLLHEEGGEEEEKGFFDHE